MTLACDHNFAIRWGGFCPKCVEAKEREAYLRGYREGQGRMKAAAIDKAEGVKAVLVSMRAQNCANGANDVIEHLRGLQIEEPAE